MTKLTENLRKLTDLATTSFVTKCPVCSRVTSDYDLRMFIEYNGMCANCDHVLSEVQVDKHDYIREHMSFHGFDPDNPEDVIAYQELGGEF